MRACVVTYTQTSKQTEEHASLNGHRCEKNLFFVGSAMTHTRIALFTSFWIIHVQVSCSSFRNICVFFVYIIFSTYSTTHIHRCLNCCCGGGGVLCHMYTAITAKLCRIAEAGISKQEFIKPCITEQASNVCQK